MDQKKKFLIAVISFLISTQIYCAEIPMNLLSAGDVVNDINLDQLTSEFIGNMFNGASGNYIENVVIDYSRMHGYTTFYNCNETAKAGYYPDIKVQGSKKFRFDNSKLTASVLRMDDRYIYGDFLCISFKHCIVKRDESVSIDLNTTSDFPEDIKPWMKQSGISGAWKENETAYVSSILTGDCIYQIVVYEQPEPSHVLDYVKEIPIYASRVSSASHNKTLEKWANDFLKNSGQSLANIQFIDKEKIFNQFHNAAIVSLRLKLLPATFALS